ncbi:hypothetical protein MRB53_023553 [Persea americana]|uniref:Uncharacterized protein n=1 Tax=Persea americana TaxID=3435 RepID=A0ACC2LAG1_PERAE|nr:hypothetical protein MRB53_023553 [Persea americana]
MLACLIHTPPARRPAARFIHPTCSRPAVSSPLPPVHPSFPHLDQATTCAATCPSPPVQLSPNCSTSPLPPAPVHLHTPFPAANTNHVNSHNAKHPLQLVQRPEFSPCPNGHNFPMLSAAHCSSRCTEFQQPTFLSPALCYFPHATPPEMFPAG